MKVTRIFDLLGHLSEKYKNKPDILCKREGKDWKKYSVGQYIDNAYNIAYGLLESGFQKGSKIITIMNNRPEWNFMDMGIMLAGMVHIPVYPTLNEEDYKFIVNHSDAVCIIIGIESIYRRVSPAFDSFINHPSIFTIDPIDGERNYNEILEIGRTNCAKWQPVVEENKQNIQPDELATIIYTSGTTGRPKGVMLSHKNLCTNFMTLAGMNTNDYKSNILSFLPLSHIYERTINYHYQFLGASLYYAGSLATIAKDLKDIHAAGFQAVPRVLEMMFDKLQAAGKDLKGKEKQIYQWAFHFATKYDNTRKDWFYLWRHQLADRLVYSKWRESFGGNPMVVVSGGSAIQERIIRLFCAMQLYVYEGYGLTETSPVIAVNNPSKNLLKPGTVGEIMPCIDFKLGEDGEILTKGDCLMMGYYKDEEYTHQVIDQDGWFHTGDIGTMVDGKYLKITDRKKEIFKLSAGKYIAPQAIENSLRGSLYITDCMVIGENEKFASAIITPNFEKIKSWCDKHRIKYTTKEEMILNPDVLKQMQYEVDKVNKGLAEHEHIKRFRMVADEWSVKTGEYSQTLKLKRKVIYDKYDALCQEIYNHENNSKRKENE